MTTEKIQSLYDTVNRLLRHEATENLKKILDKLHPTDVAEIIRRFDEKREDTILELISGTEQEPLVFVELGGAFVVSYLKRHENFNAVVETLKKLPSNDVANLVKEMPEEISRELLGRMQMDESQKITGLLQYRESTAGSLMSPEILKVSEAKTVKEAIKALQKAKKGATIFYIYIVDEYDHLTGVCSIRQLFQVPEDTILKNIMLRDVVRVRVDEKQEEVARLVAQYDVVAVPVVDEADKLVGVITVDDIIDVIKEEAAENVLKMGSAEAGSLDEFRFKTSLAKRLPWFLILFVGGILTCEVITYFYRFLPPIGIFAGFVPLILRFSGIITRQTSTIVIQGISSGTMRTVHTAFRVLCQQGAVTLVIAAISGILIAVYAHFRFHDVAMLSVGVGISLFVSMMVALFLGGGIPTVFQKMKLDPTWATGSVINFLLDVIGLFIYFKTLIWLI